MSDESTTQERELSKDDILAEMPRSPKKISLPYRGGFVYIRQLFGDDIDQLRARDGKIDERAVLAKIVTMGLVNKEGARLLKDTDFSLVNRRWVLGDLKAVAQAIKEESGLTDEDQSELAHKDRVGN